MKSRDMKNLLARALSVLEDENCLADYEKRELMEDIAEAVKEDPVQEIVDSAIRLPHDVNGNPRYWIAKYMFTGKDGICYRPVNAAMYRGKQLGDGWVFQSYNLRRSVENALKGKD